MAVNPSTLQGSVASRHPMDRHQIGHVPSTPAPTTLRNRAAPPPIRPQSLRPERAGLALEIVTSHIESLIERVVGVEKAMPDDDGDYPIRFRDAVYFVRVTGPEEQPLVRVFSHVVSHVTLTSELYELINEVNSKLKFCRCFVIDDRVVIEAEHLGMTLRTDDFRQITEHVAVASDYFGSILAERFDGRRPFSSDAEDDRAVDTPPAAVSTGLYL